MELSLAFDMNKIVIPVLVQEAAMPTAHALPEPIRALGTRNALALHDASWNADVRRLADEVGRHMGRPEVSSYVGLPRRIGAALIDLISLNLLWFVAVIVSVGIHSSGPRPPPAEATRIIFDLMGPLWWVAMIVYFPLLWWSRLGSGTLGMRAFGLRIARTDGRPVGLATACLRYVGLWFAILPIFAGIVSSATSP
jgi:uncharacterized RDD family membrane protein YckC